MLCVLLLAACQRPGMVVPTLFESGEVDAFYDVPQQEQSSNITVFFATDRKSDAGGDNWQSYGKNRSDLLDLGTAELHFGEGENWPELVALTAGEFERNGPRTDVANIYRYGELYNTAYIVDEETGLPRPASKINPASERFVKELGEALDRSAGNEITIYIHGFKNGFYEAIKTTAEYDHYTGGLGPFICYSWPSYNSVWEYSHDRDSVRYTAAHCRDFMEFLDEQIDADKLDVRRINFICHSSGAEVVGTVLRELALRSDDATPQERRDRWRIGAVLMIAPDVSTDVARERLLKEDLRGMFEQVVVYSSNRDRALRWASFFLYRTPRIGAIRETGLSDADRFWLSAFPNVMIVDVDNQPNYDPIHHSHHRYSPATASDILLCLRGNLPPNERGLVREGDALIWQFADDYPDRVQEAAEALYPAASR